MSTILIITEPFDEYVRGQRISDPAEIAKLKDGLKGMHYVAWDRPPSYGAIMSKADLLGTVSDFGTNPNSYGGNSINHVTGVGTKLVYEPALANVLSKLAA